MAEKYEKTFPTERILNWLRTEGARILAQHQPKAPTLIEAVGFVHDWLKKNDGPDWSIDQVFDAAQMIVDFCKPPGEERSNA